MIEIPLLLGPLKADGYTIHRSGVRWLCEPGQLCRANQVIAYFNLSLEPTTTRLGGPPPFGEERELQVACAPRIAGRVKFDSAATPGGYLSIQGFKAWDADEVMARLEIEDASAASEGDPERARLLLLAGRRMTPLVDVHSGLLPGWHNRSRAWWCEEGETPLTLLSLGVCDATGVILGEQSAFLEMFRAETAPRQLVFFPDHPITPATPVLLDQLERSAAQFRAISAEVHAALARAAAPTANDWMFAGTMLASLQQCPIRETCNIFSASGLRQTRPADAVLLSLNSEPSSILRHKKLGYRLNIMRHHQEAAGPVIRDWLANAFEPVPRTTADIKADYEKLVAAINQATGAQVIILNRMSTSGDENISSYAPFDSPLSGTLANISSKELNLMLHDLADGQGVAIVDIDAIAADVGGGEHLPDGVHQSGAMQEILRAEILHILQGLRPDK